MLLFSGWGIGILSPRLRSLRLGKLSTGEFVRRWRIPFAVRIPILIYITKKKHLCEMLLFSGWGIGIRTPTNRVRVCRATVTLFPIAKSIIYILKRKVNTFFKNILYFLKIKPHCVFIVHSAVDLFYTFKQDLTLQKFS